MLRAIVLGAAAGGGFPQWNSNAPGCREARRGGGRARARSQASLAVSANGDDWLILNASPDLRLQIEATPALHPRHGLRSSPIAGVVVTGGDVDAIAGLLHLRERHRFSLYAPAPVLEVIAANSIFGVLDSGLCRAPSNCRSTQRSSSEGAPGLAVLAFAVPGKVPLYRETAGEDPGLSEAGETVGLEIIDTAAGRRLFFIPGCASSTRRCAAASPARRWCFSTAPCGSDDEMIRAGVGDKTGPAHGPHQHVGRRGGDRRLRRSRNRPADLHPHQQLEPGAVRGFARTARGRGRRLGDRL